MRELLSLRRNEAAIVGEVYKYGPYYIKCVAGDAGEKCEKCAFNQKYCPFPCSWDVGDTERHFIWVPKVKLEGAADVKFRHVEETGIDTPFIGERLIAAVGLVEFVETSNLCLNDCVQCDLTQRECDEANCGPGCYYKKVVQ